MPSGTATPAATASGGATGHAAADRPVAGGRARDGAAAELDAAVLGELRAALAAGSAPGPALVAAVHGGPLAPVAQAVRLGRPLAELAGAIDTGDPTADLLVRALAVAERAGASPSVAVEQASRARRAEEALDRSLRVRTAQARGTATVLAALPLAGWLLLVGLDRGVLAFYATPIGALTAVAAVVLGGLGQLWSRRIVGAAARAGRRADPLVAPRSRVDVGPLAAVAVAALVGGGLVGGLPVGVGAAVVAVLVASRRAARRVDGTAAVPPPADTSRRSAGRPDGSVGHAGSPLPDAVVPDAAWSDAAWSDTAWSDAASDAASSDAASSDTASPDTPSPDTAGGGAAEAVELVAVALSSGLPPAAAVDLVARIGPPLARRPLADAARRLDGAWTAEAAFAGGGLERLGAVLGAAERWGAPADAELRRLATDLRDERRAAVDEAAERVQLSLVFPTTLLTLPAFVLGVVPPLLWAALA